MFIIRICNYISGFFQLIVSQETEIKSSSNITLTPSKSTNGIQNKNRTETLQNIGPTGSYAQPKAVNNNASSVDIGGLESGLIEVVDDADADLSSHDSVLDEDDEIFTITQQNNVSENNVTTHKSPSDTTQSNSAVSTEQEGVDSVIFYDDTTPIILNDALMPSTLPTNCNDCNISFSSIMPSLVSTVSSHATTSSHVVPSKAVLNSVNTVISSRFSTSNILAYSTTISTQTVATRNIVYPSASVIESYAKISVPFTSHSSLSYVEPSVTDTSSTVATVAMATTVTAEGSRSITQTVPKAVTTLAETMGVGYLTHSTAEFISSQRASDFDTVVSSPSDSATLHLSSDKIPELTTSPQMFPSSVSQIFPATTILATTVSITTESSSTTKQTTTVSMTTESSLTTNFSIQPTTSLIGSHEHKNEDPVFTIPVITGITVGGTMVLFLIGKV